MKGTKLDKQDREDKKREVWTLCDPLLLPCQMSSANSSPAASCPGVSGFCRSCRGLEALIGRLRWVALHGIAVTRVPPTFSNFSRNLPQPVWSDPRGRLMSVLPPFRRKVLFFLSMVSASTWATVGFGCQPRTQCRRRRVQKKHFTSSKSLNLGDQIR